MHLAGSRFLLGIVGTSFDPHPADAAAGDKGKPRRVGRGTHSELTRFPLVVGLTRWVCVQAQCLVRCHRALCLRPPPRSAFQAEVGSPRKGEGTPRRFEALLHSSGDHAVTRTADETMGQKLET